MKHISKVTVAKAQDVNVPPTNIFDVINSLVGEKTVKDRTAAATT